MKEYKSWWWVITNLVSIPQACSTSSFCPSPDMFLLVLSHLLLPQVLLKQPCPFSVVSHVPGVFSQNACMIPHLLFKMLLWNLLLQTSLKHFSTMILHSYCKLLQGRDLSATYIILKVCPLMSMCYWQNKHQKFGERFHEEPLKHSKIECLHWSLHCGNTYSH